MKRELPHRAVAEGTILPGSWQIITPTTGQIYGAVDLAASSVTSLVTRAGCGEELKDTISVLGSLPPM